MSRCALYTPERNRDRSDRQPNPTTLKPEEYALIPYAYAKENECGGCLYCKVLDCQWYGAFYCKVKRYVIV